MKLLFPQLIMRARWEKTACQHCVVATLVLSLSYSALYGMSNMDGRIAAFFELQDNFVAPLGMRSS